MKILITGAGGLLGQYLNIIFAQDNDVLCLYYKNPGNCKLFKSVRADLTDFDSVKKIFNQFNPGIVVHTAAVSATVLPENISSKDVYDINVRATKNLAELCSTNGSKLIYTSTDLVYAGYSGKILKEDAKIVPVSLYAETKLLGEIKIRETLDNYIILRTALLYGFGLNHSKNHFYQMYSDLREGRRVRLFTDQYRSPLSIPEAARIIKELTEKGIGSDILNLGGLERLSRFELGERLCEAAKLDKNLLIKIKLDDLPDLPRVGDVSMNTSKLQSYGIFQKSVDESLREILSRNTN